MHLKIQKIMCILRAHYVSQDKTNVSQDTFAIFHQIYVNIFHINIYLLSWNPCNVMIMVHSINMRLKINSKSISLCISLLCSYQHLTFPNSDTAPNSKGFRSFHQSVPSDYCYDYWCYPWCMIVIWLFAPPLLSATVEEPK